MLLLCLWLSRPLLLSVIQFFPEEYQCTSEMSKSIVKGIGIGFLSCIGIGIGIAKTISQVLVLVLVLLRQQPKYWYWYC